MFGFGVYNYLNGFAIDWLGGTRLSLLVTLVIRLLVGIGWYRMFERAGKKGWMAFVPVLGPFQAFRLAWDDFAFSAIFAGSTFVAWVSIVVPDYSNAVMVALSVVSVILWWIMAGFTAMAFQVSGFFGLIYGVLPWLGALVFGWTSFPKYQGPWSSDPAVNRKKEKQARKKARKLARAKK